MLVINVHGSIGGQQTLIRTEQGPLWQTKGVRNWLNVDKYKQRQL